MITPGASDASDEAARLGSGSAASISRVTIWLIVELCDSTEVGAPAVTWTVSDGPAISKVTSMAIVWPTSSVIGRLTTGSNPLSSIATRYLPGTSDATR